MTNNNVLMAVALMERVMPMLKEDKREQISRSGADSILQSMLQIYERYNNDSVNSSTTIMKMNAVIKVLSSLLEESTFYETDEETKEILIGHCKDIMADLYLVAGKYYMTNEFDYAPQISTTLNRIIDKCIAMGFYFGADKELKEEGVIK